MKYLSLLLLIIALVFSSSDAISAAKIDSVYADSIYADVSSQTNINSKNLFKKPDSQYCTITGNGATIDLAFKKYKSVILQTIKANSTILVWGKKDKAADSSAGEITFWFDDGNNAYNTQAKPIILHDGVNVVQVPGQDFTYIELSLAVDNFGKGATSFLIDAVALAQDTTPKVSVPQQRTLTSRTLSSYPNPFTTSTTIHFDSPLGGDVRLVIIDAIGREVETIDAGYEESGIHDIPLSIKLTGMYFVRLFVGGQVIGDPLKITSNK